MTTPDTAPGDDLIALAKLAYQAYGQSTDFKNYQGKPMPNWDHLGDAIQGAWVAAVDAVISVLEDGPEADDETTT